MLSLAPITILIVAFSAPGEVSSPAQPNSVAEKAQRACTAIETTGFVATNADLAERINQLEGLKKDLEAVLKKQEDDNAALIELAGSTNAADTKKTEKLRSNIERRELQITTARAEIERQTEAISPETGRVESIEDFKAKVCTKALSDLLDMEEKDGLTDLPRSYTVRIGVDICEEAETSKFGLSTIPEAGPLLSACEKPAGSGLLFAAALPVLQGLGDFLQARGKETLYDFAIDRFGRRMCRGHKADISKVPRSTSAYLFRDTCLLLYPDGILRGTTQYDAIVTADLQDAVRRDVISLPVRLLEGDPSRGDLEIERSDALQTVLVGVAEAGTSLRRGGSVYDFFIDWAEASRRSHAVLPSERRFRCDARTEGGPSGGCLALLALETVAAASQLRGQQGNPLRAMWIDNGITRFCDAYGDAGLADDGACVLGALAPVSYGQPLVSQEALDHYRETVHPLLTSACLVFDRIVELQTNLNTERKAGTPASVVVKDILPELSLITSELLKAVHEADGNANDQYEMYQLALEATVEGLSGDYKKSLRLAARFLERSKFSKRSQKHLLRTVAFALDLAAAEGRDEAAAVIEEAAAPRGTYRMKYDSDRLTVSVNSFIGPAVGYQYNFSAFNGGERDDLALRLQAPVGVDFSFNTGTAERTHFGLFAFAIDPLSISQIDQTGESTDADWGSVIVLGGLARVGVAASPLVIFAGGSYQPFLRSRERGRCSGERCWSGAAQFLAGVAVDIPLLVLR